MSQQLADAPRRLRLVLIAVCIALMAVIASVSGLNVAQPDLAVAFEASQSAILWIINVYTLGLAALLLPLGALGDRLGRKPALLAGLLVFGVANVVAGLATSTEVMFAARLLSGLGAAMIMPVTLAVITATFPTEQRGKAIGVWTGVAGGGGILGMFVSALLVDVAGWRWLFVLPVVLVAVALVLAVRYVPNSREREGRSYDVVGAVTSAVAVVGLILVLQEGPARGWGDPLTLAALVAGLLAACCFVAWELRRGEGALLDVRLFRSRGLASGSVTLLAVFGVQAGIFVVLFPFFQAVLGWSALVSTLGMMPMALLMMVSSGLAPKLAVRAGARATMVAGIALAGAGLALMAGMVSVDGGYPSLLPGMLAMGAGMGLSMTPSTEAITGALPRARQGVASALNDVTREFGTALGVALLGALLSAGYRHALAGRLDGVPHDTAATAREGLANAVEAAPGAGDRADALVDAARDAFVSGWQQAMWAGVGVMAALCVYVAVRGPGRGAPEGAEDAGRAEGGRGGGGEDAEGGGDGDAQGGGVWEREVAG
ncbi:MFS transporter [Streptomyces sp. DSM 41982]|uniref:MFS transporter n=1 Tax=Streptomyces evansiae TaxID=3075535 RepID=A0ABD5EE34_9ACTN|nr:MULTISPECIES: MFS transporter [unclassified Streptomyces]MDT0419724.1 MFS transporter [Streptomyces sp. DSM 41982]SCD91980.1 drug resistance transporter, EmrB/QacA subfamily [Streptomyces sp. SolWspMP-sol7th]